MIDKDDILKCFDRMIEYYSKQLEEKRIANCLYLWPIFDCKQFKAGLKNSDLVIEKIIDAVFVFEFWFNKKYQNVINYYDKTLDGYLLYKDKKMSEGEKSLIMDIGNELSYIDLTLNDIKHRPFMELLEVHDCINKDKIPKIEETIKKCESSEEFKKAYIKKIENIKEDDLPIVELGGNTRNSVKYFEEIMDQEYPELHVNGKIWCGIHTF